MKPKVSIVIPVHNAGKDFHVCLNSLINQTLREIEILCVLDVPTDGSDRIAEEYARKDSRIRIIWNEKNLHIGFSRNAGIDNATGEYIGFSDDDDFCDPQMFETLYHKAITNNADIVVSNYINEQAGRVDTYCFPNELSEDAFKQKYFEALILGNHSQPNTTSFDNVNPVWNQIFRLDFLNSNRVRFPDNKIMSMEDVIFNLQAHFHALKVSFVPEIFYHHRMNEKNAFNNYEYLSPDKVIPHLNFVYDFLNKYKITANYQNLFAICTLRRLYTSLRNEITFRRTVIPVAFIQRIRKNSDIQQMISPLFGKDKLVKKLPLTKRIFAYLIRK